MSFGYMVIGPDGEDETFGVHFGHYWRMRHESATARQFCRTLLYHERIRRERITSVLWPGDVAGDR